MYVIHYEPHRIPTSGWKPLPKREKSFWAEEGGAEAGEGRSCCQSCSQELGAQQTHHPAQSSPTALADIPVPFGQHQHLSVVMNPKQPPKCVPSASPRGLSGMDVQTHLLLMRDMGQCDKLDLSLGY